jgi:archaemetzincin
LINPTGHTIVVSPMEDLEHQILDRVLLEIRLLFGYHTEIIPLLRDLEFAYDPVRRQYHSTRILERLAGLAPSHAVKVLGITQVDLFIPILTHVYGEAQLGGRASVVSFHRLKEGLPVVGAVGSYECRAVKEALHELGHTFNLRHCKDHACIMHYCRSLRDVDAKSDQLCRYCSVMLEDEIKRLGETFLPSPHD